MDLSIELEVKSVLWKSGGTLEARGEEEKQGSVFIYNTGLLPEAIVQPLG